MKRKYPASLFFIGLLLNFIGRFFYLFIIAVFLTVIGIWVKPCLAMGLIIFALDLILSLAEQIMIARTTLNSDNPNFEQFQDAVLSGDWKNGVNDYVRSRMSEQEKYESMTNEQLSELSDEELFDAVYDKINYAVDSFENTVVGMRSLSPAARTFFVTSYYESEVNNGGLCQFFVNSGRAVAPELSVCLAEIGADEHRTLFDSFIAENSINVNDLSSFDIDNVGEFENQTQRYDFDKFDSRFYKMKPICEYLTAYIRDHIAEF